MHPSNPTPLRARKAAPLKGVAGVPGDKSISQRALILGALAVGGAIELALGSDELSEPFAARSVRELIYQADTIVAAVPVGVPILPVTSYFLPSLSE